MTGPLDTGDRGLYAISVAAELTGLHPQTLRIYEREGLVAPARSEGGTRRYSQRDIDRLNEIAALMAAGLNLVGVRRVLELEFENRRLQGLLDARRPPRHRPSAAPGFAQADLAGLRAGGPEDSDSLG